MTLATLTIHQRDGAQPIVVDFNVREGDEPVQLTITDAKVTMTSSTEPQVTLT